MLCHRHKTECGLEAKGKDINGAHIRTPRPSTITRQFGAANVILRNMKHKLFPSCFILFYSWSWVEESEADDKHRWGRLTVNRSLTLHEIITYQDTCSNQPYKHPSIHSCLHTPNFSSSYLS